MTLRQSIEIGPFTFTVLRILIAVGLVRIVVRRERLTGGWNGLDSLIVMWGLWLAAASVFHENISTTVVTHLGFVYNVWGIYFLLRFFCTSLDDFVPLCRAAALVLLPVALEMVYEQVAFHNLFSVLGGVPAIPDVRDGRIRATGPFAHSILAGTVGGVTLPLMMGVWRTHRMTACLGILTCSTMVVASASSGPLMSSAVGVSAVCLWRFRGYTRAFRWSLVAAYFVLLLVMSRPPYYLIQRFELVGGSTGWYRARLIESSIEHIDEWWFAGTDYTRHWMQYNVTSANHTDITNHYLFLGVMGGLPLVMFHLGILAAAFSFIGRGLIKGGDSSRPIEQQFMLWAFGSALVAHVVTNISVSYFDQSFLFLYLVLAAVGSSLASKQPLEIEHAVRSAWRTPRLDSAPNPPSLSRMPARQRVQ